MRLDELDVGILRLLRENARLSYRKMAERLGSSTPTVSSRVKTLEDAGVITGYRAEMDPAVLGGRRLILTVRAPPARLGGVAEALAAAPGVEEVLLLSGGRLHARARVRPPDTTLADIHGALATAEGVASYDVAEVLDTPHRAAGPPVPEEVEVPCHQCQGPIRGEPVTGALGGRSHVFCCRTCLGAFRERYQRHAAGE